jgi:hypothetical protein
MLCSGSKSHIFIIASEALLAELYGIKILSARQNILIFDAVLPCQAAFIPLYCRRQRFVRL